MPTVVVNFMTAVHASSTGMSIAFPDVCKTPAPPAPSPIPIPYPNIGSSSDTSKEIKKVKMDSAKVMGKGSVFKMSSGDEAGVAQGLVSSKIKGKCEFANYSFDVKAGGKNVARLADPMKQNQGSSPNTAGPALLQAPNVVAGAQAEACKRTDEKHEETEENSPDPNWKGAGVISPHQSAFATVAAKRGVVIMIRGSNPSCEKWIKAMHRPKPPECKVGKTMKASTAHLTVAWFMERWVEVHHDGRKLQDEDPEAYDVLQTLEPLLMVAGKFNYAGVQALFGVVGLSGGVNAGMPLLAREGRGGVGPDDVGISYAGKWVTGDYDLADIMFHRDGCVRLNQDGPAFGTIKKELNAEMGWDGIQHGPQAQWVDPKLGVDMPAATTAFANTGAIGGVVLAPGQKPLPTIDTNQVVVYPGGAVRVNDAQGAQDSLLCMKCDKPSKEV